MDSPLISVVIPTYNRAHLLPRALKSVLSQSHQNLEILIVDDASTDNTAKVVRSYDDRRIKYIEHHENRGGGASRNTGIMSATGDYIAFLDSDDEWRCDKIERQLDVLENTNTKLRKCTIVYNQSRILTRTRRAHIVPKHGIQNNECVSDYIFVNQGTIHTPTIMGSAPFFKSNLFDESLPRHQDFQFIFDAENKGANFAFIKKPLTTVHWEMERNSLKKGWTPVLSEDFAKKYRDSFTSRGYSNFIFRTVIRESIYNSNFKFGFNKLKKIKIKYLTPYNVSLFLRSIVIGSIKKVMN